MKHIVTLSVLAVVVVGCASSSPAPRRDALARGFVEPPDSAKPRTWWHWVSGNVSKEGITADLEAMKRIGVGGAQCFSVEQVPNPKDRGHVLYMSPEWRELTKFAISEAARLGLELTIHDCEGWSESGGPWITPEMSQQKVVWTEKRVTGPRELREGLAQPETVKGFYRDIAVFAFPSLPGDAAAAPVTKPATMRAARANRRAPKPAAGPGRIPDIAAKAAMESHVLGDPPATQASEDDIIKREELVDLTDKFDSAKGKLSWDVPEGEWTIVRFGHTSTGRPNAPAMAETRGLECDKLDPNAVKAHFDGMLGKITDESRPLMGKGLKYVLMDSWECGCQNWTPRFREEFQKRRGYDPVAWMVTMTGRYVESPEKTERFLWDLRRTIADMIAENHYGLMASMLHENKLGLYAEAPGIGMPTTADELQCKGKTDVPMGEFWVNRIDDSGDTREAASAAHIYAKTIAAAESFTAVPENAGWRNDPFSLKVQGDREFCNGINRYVFHRYAHQPWNDRYPGMTMGPWGINFERTNTWWEPGAAWISYISRCQYMLQRGLFVADLVYYYGEDTPICLQPSQLQPPPPKGFDYDGCNREVLLTRMTVRDGRIVLPDGMSYRVLVLPASKRMSVEVARKVKELVSDGAMVIGPKPERAPGLSDFPKCDEEVRAIAEEVWADCDGKDVTEHKYGKGRVIVGRTPEEVLAEVGKDFEATSLGDDDAEFRYIHRRDGGAEIYFVSSQQEQPAVAEYSFRVSGKVPELWHPQSGAMERARVYRVENGRTIVPIDFDPAESVFVVFRDSDRGVGHFTSLARGGELIMPPTTQTAPTRAKLQIRSAVYGALADAKQQADVTEKLAGMVKGGSVVATANNDLAGRDPALNVHKQLRVEYVIDSEPGSVTVEEGKTVRIPSVTRVGEANRVAEFTGERLVVYQDGNYTVRGSDGQTRTVHVSAIGKPREVTGSWALRFPPQWGAPDEVMLDRLSSWTQHDDAGVKYFSGTAKYVRDIDIPAEMLGKNKRIYLDLGEVKNLAEVKLNGKMLGTLWKPPFRIDVTSVAKPGMNRLVVAVTNLWPNRLIGDLSLPEGERFTWSAFNPYKKDSSLLPSGLLGPVRLVPAVVLEVK